MFGSDSGVVPDRHRLLLNFEGEAAELTTDRVLDEIQKKTK